MARPQGWIPQQHGAWAMLAVPCLVALVLSARIGGVDALPGRLLLVATFWAGYFAFAACSLWLKARHRDRFRRPLLTYGALTAVLGAMTVVVIGPSILMWGAVYAPLTLATLLLVSRGQERSLLSGALTVAAATCFAITILAPTAWFTEPWCVGAAVSVLTFGYFFGTVFFVKTMLRRRGDRAWFAASICWHAACVALAAWGALRAWWTAGYVVFFAAALLRAIVVPLVGPLARRPRRLTPAQLGMMESAFSVALTLALLVAPPLWSMR